MENKFKDWLDSKGIKYKIDYIPEYREMLTLNNENDLRPFGMLIAVLNHNVWDPNVKVMNELAYWVDEDQRGTSAGYRLLEMYRKHCQQMVTWLSKGAINREVAVLFFELGADDYLRPRYYSGIEERIFDLMPAFHLLDDRPDLCRHGLAGADRDVLAAQGTSGLRRSAGPESRGISFEGNYWPLGVRNPPQASRTCW